MVSGELMVVESERTIDRLRTKRLLTSDQATERRAILGAARMTKLQESGPRDSACDAILTARS